MMLKFFLILSISLSPIYGSTCGHPNPCNGHPQSSYYAQNPRGCGWYFTCNPDQPAKEGRCDEQFFFNHEKQMCDWKSNVDCVDAVPVTSCPASGVHTIQHPSSCARFTGELFLVPKLVISSSISLVI